MDGDVSTSVHDGRAIVHVRGDVDLSLAPQLQSRLHRAIDGHPATVITVDLDGVTSIDANGLGVLVAALGRATSRDGDIAIRCSSPELRAQFAACRLDRVFLFVT
jgi:anti-anti-sigma factor